MKNLLIITILVLALLALSSCSDFTSPKRFDGDVYSISGLLLAESSVNLQKPIYVLRSTSVNDFSAESLFVTDAIVTIHEYAGDQIQKSFVLEPVLDLDLEAAIPMPKIKYIDPQDNIILADTKYRIEVVVPGYDKTIWAETTVPKPATITPDYFSHNSDQYGYSTDPNTTLKIKHSEIDTHYPLALNMGEYSGPQYFFSQFFCLEEFSTDLEFTTPVIGFENPDENMRDGYYQAGESIRRIHILGRYTSMPQSDAEDNYLMVRDYKQAFVFYGKYRVTAYVVDNNYYRYSFMPEGYLHGGVRNGLGYFGSASGGVLYTEIVKD